MIIVMLIGIIWVLTLALLARFAWEWWFCRRPRITGGVILPGAPHNQ